MPQKAKKSKTKQAKASKDSKATPTKLPKTTTAKQVPVVSQPIHIHVVDNEPPAFKVLVRQPGLPRKKLFGRARGFVRTLRYIWRAFIVVYSIVFYRLVLMLIKAIYRQLKPLFRLVLKQTKRVTAQTRRKLVILAASIVVVHIGYITLFGKSAPPPPKTTSRQATPTPKLSRGTPSYKTLLPTGKTIQSLGGWTRVSPPGRNPVYAYVDKLGGVQIDVSEQPLPDNLKSDIAVQQLAQGFNATNKIDASGTTAYIGTSANGPQSVIYVKNNLLILIKSTAPASDALWAAYISSLK